MRKSTKTLALGGIAAALTFVLCWVGSVSASGKFIMPGLCGIFLMVMARHVSGKAAMAVYVVSAVVLLLLPDKLSTFAYILLLGYYPMLCQGVSKMSVWLQLIIKLAVLTAAGCVALFWGAAMLGLWENEKFVRYYPLMIAAYYVIAGIYDLFLWLLRRKFAADWDKKLQKLLR